MSEVSFDRVISEHLALSKRNRRLERQMPLDGYRDGAPNDEPATEASGNGTQEPWLDQDSFWDTSGERPLPEFDWGDD